MVLLALEVMTLLLCLVQYCVSFVVIALVCHFEVPYLVTL